MKSRKTHGSAGTFDLTLNASAPITGSVTGEPRFSGAGHKIVFQFPSAIGSVGSATALDAQGMPVAMAYAVAAGNEVIVTLTGMADNRRATVTVNGINGIGTASVSLGFLVGDVNSNRSVSAKDISTTKARIGQAVSQLNFRSDVNASGAITQADLNAVKARSGMVLP